MSNQRRIMKEFDECSKTPPEGIKIRLMDEADFTKWEVIIDGPNGTPYTGGHFKLILSMPSDYPFKPPSLNFETKIYHPNVSNDDKGSMCLGMLRPDTWKPPNRLIAVLKLARSLLAEPQPDDAVEAQIADQYKTNRAEFEKNAKDWTKRYASGTSTTTASSSSGSK